MSPRPTAYRLLASALAGLLAAWPAWASDSSPKVVVLPLQVISDSVPAEQATKSTDVLTDQLKAIEGVTLVPLRAPAASAPAPAEPSRTAAPKAANAAFGEGSPAGALAQIDRGAELVRHYKFKQGADDLAAGISDYEALPGQVDANRLHDAYVQLAVAQMRSGDAAAGTRSLGDAVRVAPDLPLSGNYPPVFRRAFEGARKHALSGPKGNVTIKGDGAVQLDGKVIGPAPASAQDLIQGEHFIRVTRSDGTTWAIKAMIGDGDNTVNIPPSPVAPPTPQPVVVALAPLDLSSISQNHIDAALMAQVGQGAEQAGADFAVFGGVYKSADGVGLATHLYNAKTHDLTALKVAKYDSDMVSAGMEINKPAVEAEGLVHQASFPEPESVPAPVAAELVPEGTKVVVAVPDAGSPDVLVPPRDAHPAAELGDNSEISKPGDEKPASRTWIWFAAGGAALLLGGAAAGYVIYKNQTTPVTGTATVSFQ